MSRAVTRSCCSSRRRKTERILREAVARHGVTPQWNTELVGIGQDALSKDASPVQGILKLADGSLERVAAPWLISAEGAHSLVRTTLDLPFEGHTREEQYVLGDLLVAGDLPDSDTYIFSSDHGFMGLFPMGGEHFRLSPPIRSANLRRMPNLRWTSCRGSTTSARTSRRGSTT